MRAILIFVALIVLGLTGCTAVGDRHIDDSGIELANGHWYNGSGFGTPTMYLVGNRLSTERPRSISQVVDLDGGFVVPPYGDAHSHRPSTPERVAASNEFFAKRGVFYVQNQGSLAQYRDELIELTSQPGQTDVAFSHAMISSSQSHGVDLWQRLADGGVFPGITSDQLEGNAFFTVDSSDDLESVWVSLIDTQPDFVKVMIEYSEEYELRSKDPEFFGRSGLDPDLIPQITNLAHGAGLPVSAHIETAHDFGVALAAGVDTIAHLPGYDILEGESNDRFRISESDAKKAAKQGTVVVTTALLSLSRAKEDLEKLERIQEVQRDNIDRLHRAGVKLVIGSDQYNATALEEAMHLSSLTELDNATILQILCVATPRAIYPERNLGELSNGAVADFLVLGGNPLESLDELSNIKLRVKDGIFLKSIADAPTP